MMLKHIILFTIGFFSTMHLKSQVFVSAYCGYGKYSMFKLKEFNDIYLNSYAVDVKVVDNFPARPYYGIEVSKKHNKIEFGGEIFFNTTGSKAHYQDYSGEVNFTQRIGATSLGGLFKAYLIDNKIIIWNMKFGLSASKTNLELYEAIKIFDEMVDEHYYFTSFESRINIGTELTYNIKTLRISIFTAGEAKLFAETFRWTEDSTVKLENKKGEKIKPGWSGYLYGLKLGINMNSLINL